MTELEKAALTDDDLDCIDMAAKQEANQNPHGTHYHWRKAYLRSFANNLAQALATTEPRVRLTADITDPAVPEGVSLDDLTDRLVAISSAVADSDDRAAQSLLREALAMLDAARKETKR